MENEIFAQVQEIVADQFDKNKDEITMATSFYNDLNADSLDLFQIVTELEDKYGIEFSNDDADKIKTIGDAIAYIKNKKG